MYIFSKMKITIIFHLIMKVIYTYYLKEIFFEKDRKLRKYYLESVYL